MAINKSTTSPFVKTMIIILAISFVAGIGFTGVIGLSSCSPNAPLLPNANSGSTGSAADTSATIAAINARFNTVTAARETSLTADPKNYDLLIAQANDYYDWASQVLQTAKQITTDDQQLWTTASTFYARALALKPGDPNVTTDYTISLFYSGDVTKAISEAEALRKADPKFAPVVFNLGIFYENSGLSDAKTKAIGAFQDYLKLEPNGSNAANAKQYITDLQKAGTGTTGSSTTTP